MTSFLTWYVLHALIWFSIFIYSILTGNVQSGAKLEILIVCRFAKLSVDEQRIARTASIIGTSFASDVLNNILPKQLHAYLPTILDSLVRSHWLNISSEQRVEGIRVQYSFSHPLLHRTLYDLTPSSVKCKVHLLIAKVILISCHVTSCYIILHNMPIP
jgi:predicted ATPase